MKIINRKQIEKLLLQLDLLPAIEQGFVQYAQGLVNVPPVAEMIMDKGEMHIKYGYIKGGDYYVVKMSSGFYGNTQLGIPSSNGLVHLFSQETGELVCALFDEGLLTDIRTAVAGAVVAKYMAPSKVNAIGILGTGIQAKLQLAYLRKVTDCRRVYLWGRNTEHCLECQQEMEQLGFNVSIANAPREVAQNSNLIITTTPAKAPLLMAGDVMPGTHITAVGSDMEDKQELDAKLLLHASRLVSDSPEQAQFRGEIFRARSVYSSALPDVIALGDVIGQGEIPCAADEISIADLTGVAVQDIKIAEAVYAQSVSEE